MVNFSGLNFVQGSAPAMSTDTVVVLEFWATWCGPCLQTIPHLSEINTRVKDKNVVVVGVTQENNQSQIQQFVQRMGGKMNYNVAIDASGSLSNEFMAKYQVRGIPHAFVINKEGNVSWHGHPADPNFETEIDKAANQQMIPNPKNLSLDEVKKLPVRMIKKILATHKVDYSDCVEKQDLIDRVKTLM